jgi:AraC-like DNA-binding protein
MSDTVSKTSHTSYIGNVINVAKTLDSYGVDGTRALIEAGIDVNSTPAFDARVSTGLLHKALVAHAVEKLDPLVGLKFAEFVYPTSYHAFGVMLTSSTTPRAFCQRLRRYHSYISTGDRVYFDDRGTLSYEQGVLPELFGNSYDRIFHESAWVATILKMARLVSRPDYAPQKVSLAMPEPEGYTEQYAAYFRCPIEYDAPRTALCFRPEDVDKPLPGGNAELARHSECLVYNYLKNFTKFGIINRARMSLFELLPRGDFSLDSLAESLDTSAVDVSSQLKDAGTSYQQLLGDTRRELAEEYIERADLTVNEIAYMLGFSDCSNFARSFRRWTGTSPTDYRDHKRGS